MLIIDSFVPIEYQELIGTYTYGSCYMLYLLVRSLKVHKHEKIWIFF
jgi:hypothetical protein